MAITLLSLNDTTGKVSEVYLDVNDYTDEVLFLKQYDDGRGDWVAMTKPMLIQLRDWITKEFG